MAATVRISDKSKTKITASAEIGNINKTQIAAKNAKKEDQDEVKAKSEAEEETHVTTEDQKQKTPKKLNEQYQDILALPETAKI